jgi:hypothetical protein
LLFLFFFFKERILHETMQTDNPSNDEPEKYEITGKTKDYIIGQTHHAVTRPKAELPQAGTAGRKVLLEAAAAAETSLGYCRVGVRAVRV